jgi:hypothetical protein
MKEVLTMAPTDTTSQKEYTKHLYAESCGNLDKIEKFLEKYSLSKLTQDVCRNQDGFRIILIALEEGISWLP